ncbi:ATPase-like protein, partial [Kickxella alabastrina]
MASDPMPYASVALLVDSIDSLIGFAKTIGTTGQALIDIKEGVAFMQILVDAQHTKFIAHVSETSKDSVVVELDNCAFSWGKNKFTLDPITLRVKAGEFVTIIGRIGGGKSSLLSGLCGEMPVVGGHGRVYGKI